jgi:hypothetical protein
LDYKKIAIYALIILAGFGYWYKTRLDDTRKSENEDRFASVYAATSFMAQVHRADSAGYFPARDSIYRVYDVDSSWINDFVQSMENKEDQWTAIWIMIKHKTDSLIEYYRANPAPPPVVDSATKK